MDRKMVPLKIDLERLLSPISIEHPSGEYLRYEGTYDRIQEARREGDPNLPQGVWERPLKKGDWEAVRDICLDSLETRSKDLQLAVWLLEAWMHLHGFSGVKEGLKLLISLCESFWDDLYPEMDGDDVEYRISPIEWMNEKLPVSLKLIPITQPQTGDKEPYAYADWERSLRMKILTKPDTSDSDTESEHSESDDMFTMAEFRESVMLTPNSFYVALSEDLGCIVSSANAFERLMYEELGNRAPSFQQFKGAIMDIQRLINEFTKERTHEKRLDSDANSDIQKITLRTEYEAETRSRTPSTIRNRAEAYWMLSQAADYILRTEPHSPVPYLVKRAISWGSMTLGEVLQELLKEGSDLQSIYTLLGIEE